MEVEVGQHRMQKYEIESESIGSVFQNCTQLDKSYPQVYVLRGYFRYC